MTMALMNTNIAYGTIAPKTTSSEFISFTGTHQSIHQRSAIRERSIVVSSFGKTFHVTGWKIGYCIAPEALTAELRKLGLTVTPSVGNFLLVHFPNDDARNAPAADAYLQEHGFVVRRMDSYGLAGALRITVGAEEANRGLVACLKAFLS